MNSPVITKAIRMDYERYLLGQVTRNSIVKKRKLKQHQVAKIFNILLAEKMNFKTKICLKRL